MRRRVEHLAGPDAEGGLVPRANDASSATDALGHRAAGMRTGGANRADRVAVAEEQELGAFGLHRVYASGGDIAQHGDRKFAS